MALVAVGDFDAPSVEMRIKDRIRRMQRLPPLVVFFCKELFDILPEDS